MLFQRIMRGILSLVGLFVGYKVGADGIPFLAALMGQQWPGALRIGTLLIVSVIFGIIGFLITPLVVKWIRQTLAWVEIRLQKVSPGDMVYGTIGLITGLVIAFLLTFPFASLPWVGRFLPIIGVVIFGYLGARVAVSKREELQHVFDSLPRFRGGGKGGKAAGSKGELYKILDTSVIIDGRIADICKSGFVEGVLVIPQFVLEELQHIADSSDMLKRNRGRRGLDVLNKIQKEIGIPVKILEQDYEDITEVDSKLVRLAKQLGGKVFTNDYNLNKVAELQGVEVLNINELANALKPVVLPGEEMIVHVVKDGKETGQGIAYLEDGTMIVVDGGRRHIGESVDVVVTSVLQTAAGRMIFAKPSNGVSRTSAMG